MKKIACRTNELINLVKNWMIEKHMKRMHTPFEEEWQCAHLEQHNVACGVMLIDGDCIELGVKTYFNVNSNSKTFQAHDESVEILSVNNNPMFPMNAVNGH